MQRGVERAVLHLQEFIRSTLNVLPDLVTVSGSKQRSVLKMSMSSAPSRSPELAFTTEDILPSIWQRW
jgi:hypothetical protein